MRQRSGWSLNAAVSSDLSDYVVTNLQEPLSRVAGVGDIQVFGSQYAMRIWLDPAKLLQFKLVPADVRTAVQAQNAQVSSGQVGGLPAIDGQQLNATITAQSRLQTPEQFGNILLVTRPDGSTVRLRDVAAQVVQPHQRAVVRLAVVVGEQQLLGERHCGLEVALRLGLGELLAKLRGGAPAPLLALLRQPVGKVGAVVEAECAKQFANRSSAIGQCIDGHAVSEEQCIFPSHQLGGVVFLEARDLLAQRLACVVGVGPQQRSRARARDAGLERHQRQQAGGAPLERLDAAVGSDERGITEQAQLSLWCQGAGSAGDGVRGDACRRTCGRHGRMIAGRHRLAQGLSVAMRVRTPIRASATDCTSAIA